MSEDLLTALQDRQRLGIGKPPEQPLTEGSAQKLEQLQSLLDQSSKSREQVEVEDVAWKSEDSLAAAQRFFSSMALGWGDEMGLWTAAAAASVATGNPIEEIYADMRKDYDAKQEEFKQRHEGAALAADIAGSIASPANLIGAAGLGTKAIGSLGAVGQMAAKFPGAQRVGKAVEKAAQLDIKGAPQLAARAAAEGAIYGAGEAKEGERLAGAGYGLAGGLGGYGAVRALTATGGKALSSFTRRNVEGDLIDDAGEFVPITLAASKPTGIEGAVHTFYRDVVAPSFGAKGVIKQQEARIIDTAEEFYESQKAFSKQLDQGLKETEKRAKEQLADAKKAMNEELKELNAKKKSTVLKPLEEKLASLRSGNAEEIVNKASSDVKKAVDARRFDFRNQAFSAAMPSGATASDVQKILAIENIGQRARALDQLWSKKGYSMIKGKKIRVNKNEFEKSLSEGITSDPIFKVLLPEMSSFKNNIMGAVNSVDKFRDASNRIDGDVLSAIRSRLGTIAAAAGDPQMRKAYYMAQGKIDDIIQKQLTPSQLQAFKKEAANWKTTVVLRDAIEGARNTVSKRGSFDESDWIKAASSNNKLDKRYGTGPLVNQAHVLETNLQSMEKTVAKRAANLAKTKARVVEQTIKDHTSKLEKQLDNIRAENAAKQAKLRSNPAFAEDIAKNTLLKQQKEQEVAFLKKQLDMLSKLRSPQTPSWFHTLAATGILATATTAGGLTGGLVGAAGLASAAGLGRALATPTAQKIVAGQTAPQMAAQRFLQADATGRTADILSRSIGRVVGTPVAQGMLTGQ